MTSLTDGLSFRLAYGASAGQWYAGLNFTVHAPMYTYYFIGSVIGKDAFVRYLRPIAPFITSIQIVQMAAYMYVNTMVWVYYYQDALPTPKVLPSTNGVPRHLFDVRF